MTDLPTADRRTLIGRDEERPVVTDLRKVTPTSDEGRRAVGPAPSAGSRTVVYGPRRTRRMMSEAGLERLLRVVAPLAALVVWEVLVRLEVLDDRFFPAPSTLGPALVDSIQDGTLWGHCRATFGRLLAGFAIGAVPGIAIGLVMGVSRWVRYALQPLFSALYPVPKIAIFPLLILILGLGESSKIAVVALGVFFIVLFNTVSGVLAVPQILRDAGRNFGANGFFEFRTVAFPGAMPHIFTGLRLGMGTGMLVLVSAEFVGSDTGLGYMIWQSWQVFKIENLFIGLTAVAIIGYVMIQVVELVEKVVVKWRY